MRNGQSSTLFLAFVLVIGILTACTTDRGVEAARDDQPPSVAPAEQDFMMKASQAHTAEVDAARLALHRSQDGEVKDYANMIESDHRRGLERLADLMLEKNVSRPAEPAQTQQDISRMNELSGSEFDREFVNMMVMDHQKAVELFRDMQSIAQNADVKDYVDDLLPDLEMHLDKARRLQSKLFSEPARP